MKRFIHTLSIILSTFSVTSQVSSNITLLDNWQDDNLVVNSSDVRYNECWGFTQNGKEYAIAGSTEGSHFFKISDNNKFELVDFVEGNFNSPSVIHRDYKVFKNYAYAVCDEGESSLQIIDLSYLPDSVHVVGENDSTFARVHNLFIDTTNELMYACLITPKVGGVLQSQQPMQVFSLSDPLNPAILYSGPSDLPTVHDAFVINNVAYLNCGFDGLRVYDFNNPVAPIFIQNLNIYQDQGYNHQGWLSPDGTKYVFGDETEGKRLKFCEVGANHELTINSSFGSNFEESSIPHNIMLSNNFAYVAYYNEGLRIFDLRNSVPKEIAHYDTYPDESLFKMDGAWGIYSNLPSQRLIVSDRHNGLFLFDFREDVFNVQSNGNSVIYPNPVAQYGTLMCRFKLEGDSNSSYIIHIYDMAGNKVSEHLIENQTYAEIPISVNSGMYTLRILYNNYLGNGVEEIKKFVVQ